MSKSKNGPSIGLIVFAVVAAVLIVVCAAVGVVFANRTFSPEAAPENPLTDFVNVVDSAVEENIVYYDELSDMTDLQELVATWASSNNNAKMYATDVTTYMLVIKEAAAVTTNYGSADAIALISVNSAAETINVVAIDNNILTYVDMAGTGLKVDGPVYAKLTTAYAGGGAALLQKTLENNFKIEIDHYLVTDMDGVKTIVDALNGLKITTDPEMADMVQADFGVSLPLDGNAWNGEQTVAYLREKKDGPDSRVFRQSIALETLLKTVREMGISDVFGFVKTLSDIVKTDLSGPALIDSLLSTLMGGWKDYNVIVHVLPDVENAVQYKDSAWVRVIDIPTEAQHLQGKLFEKTNITLNESRLSATMLIAAVNKLFAEEQAKAEEPTTLEPVTDEDGNIIEPEPVTDENGEPIEEVSTEEEDSTVEDSGSVG